MTKILDFLYENYIYVIIISSFLIITLIGFITKESKKGNKIEKNNKEIESNSIENIVDVEPILLPQTENIPVVEIGTQRLQVKLEENVSNQKDDILFENLKLDDTIVLNKEELDKEIDIIDFKEIEKYKSNNDNLKPIE